VGINLGFLTPGEMGGLEVYARQLVSALARRGDPDLTLMVNCLCAGDPFWAEQGEVATLPADPRRRTDWVLADQRHVPREAQRRGLELVHSLASTGPAHGRFGRVTTVQDLNYLEHPDAHFGIRSLGMRLLVPLAVRRSHRVIVPSAATRSHLVARLGANPHRIDVVPLGIGQPPGGSFRRPAGLGHDGRPLVLSPSAKRPHKNLGRLIDAVAAIPPERRPLLVIPGYPTPHEDELRERAGRLGVSEDVRFLGWVDEEELEGLYRAASCVVFPSLHEGFGLPVLEAMARGVPVATSGRTSLAEVAGDAALLFDPEDAGSIAAAIERLLHDGGLAERLATAGRAQAARFTWEAAAEGTVAAYRRTLSTSP
jgi:glycosyltransferase involved in cell wall biosynthesis